MTVVEASDLNTTYGINAQICQLPSGSAS